MPFTDDNLKRLKESLLAAHERARISGYVAPIQMLPKSFDALLARLEAAEVLAKEGHIQWCEESLNLCDCGYEAWRKAAGKA